MQILETHASNDKEAAELAATYLDVEPDLVDVELYKKGSSGFLGFGEKEPAIYHVIATEGKTPFQVVKPAPLFRAWLTAQERFHCL